MSAPRLLERLAALCLKAEAHDSRLGDLSEQHVRTREWARTYLGNTSLATTVSHFTADIRYLFSAANVMLFARAVDPVLRLSEPDSRETIVLDFKERTMALLYSMTRRMVLPALLLVGSAFLVNGAVNVWTQWRETEALLLSLQREKAEGAAAQIGQRVAAIQNQVAFAALPQLANADEQRRIEFLKLMRFTPEVTEIARLNSEGKETLKVSRLHMDNSGSGADFSKDARFTEAVKRRNFIGPVYLNKRSDPHISVAVGFSTGVTMAEVNIKLLWDIIDKVKVGETGYAYVVDEKGRLIASKDRARLLQQATAPNEAEVLTADATVPGTEWKVFVELPVAEARAPLWSAMARAAILLGLGVLAIFLASVVAVRRDARAEPART